MKNELDKAADDYKAAIRADRRAIDWLAEATKRKETTRREVQEARQCLLSVADQVRGLDKVPVMVARALPLPVKVVEIVNEKKHWWQTIKRVKAVIA